MRYIVILNEEAGKAGQAAPGASAEDLRAAFAEAGVDADVRVPPAGELEAALRAAVAARPDAIVTGGGDGTARTAAALLADTGIPFGVLPLGTFNHFAKDLKLPVDAMAAVAVLAAGATRDIDVGEVNGHVFINNCSLGAYAEAVRRRDALRSRRGLAKGWAMCRASYGEFRRLRRLRLRISVKVGRVIPNPPPTNGALTVTRPTPDNFRLVRTPVVVVGNNRYSGHLLSHNLRPRLDEGRLWLYTVHARRHLAVLRMMFQSLFGQLDEAEHLAAEPATEIFIEGDGAPVPIAADGEVLKLNPPFHFKIRPKALRVLVPAECGKAEGEGRKENRASREEAKPANVPSMASSFKSQVSAFRFLRQPQVRP